MSDRRSAGFQEVGRGWSLGDYPSNPRSGWKHSFWGEAKRNPRIIKGKTTERAKRPIELRCDSLIMSGCRPHRGLFSLYSNDPGVPLRFTPGFMLSPRFAGSM